MENNYSAWEIGSHVLEYYDDHHVYICDGLVVPSITQVMKVKFGNKYDTVSPEVLKRASEQGTAVHEAIEKFCEHGTESDLPEVRNFKFLQKTYGFKVLENELPVILFEDDEPICAGRLDLIIEIDGKEGIADIKRTSALDKEYLSYQLNLYRIAYWQTYGIKTEFLKGIHLREDVRKFVNIPINENLAWGLIHDWRKKDE